MSEVCVVIFVVFRMDGLHCSLLLNKIELNW